MEAEPERRRYTMGSEGGGRDHKTRNSALDVEKSKKHRLSHRPSRGSATHYNLFWTPEL